MPASPSITLTATVQDLFGVAIGSLANPCKLCIALCGFGPQLPRIGGTSLIGRVGPIYLESTTGIFSTPLWANDAITPSGTYYTISLVDGQGNVVQSGAYQFTGTGTFDLSSLTPYILPAFTSPSNYVLVPFSATPLFTGGWPASSITFDITLTANVTSSAMGAIFKGQLVQFLIQQDGTGNRAFTWPSNVINPPSVNTVANSVTSGLFIMRGNGNLYPILGWS